MCPDATNNQNEYAIRIEISFDFRIACHWHIVNEVCRNKHSCINVNVRKTILCFSSLRNHMKMQKSQNQLKCFNQITPVPKRFVQ